MPAQATYIVVQVVNGDDQDVRTATIGVGGLTGFNSQTKKNLE